MMRKILFLSIFFSFIGCSSPNNRSKTRLGYDITFFNSNEQTQKMKGFFDELVQLLEKKTGLNIEIIPTNEGNLVDLLDRGQLDLIYHDLDANIVNQSKFSFSVPICYNGLYLVTQKGDDRGLSDLQERRVLAPITESMTFMVAKYPKVLFLYYEDPKEPFLALMNSYCSAVLIGASDFKGYENEFDVQTNKITNKYFSFISKKGDRTESRIDRALQELHKESAIQELKDKWQIEPKKTSFLPL